MLDSYPLIDGDNITSGCLLTDQAIWCHFVLERVLTCEAKADGLPRFKLFCP